MLAQGQFALLVFPVCIMTALYDIVSTSTSDNRSRNPADSGAALKGYWHRTGSELVPMNLQFGTNEQLHSILLSHSREDA